MADLNAIVDRLGARWERPPLTPCLSTAGSPTATIAPVSAPAEYMVRLPGKDTALLGISRTAERIANQAAADLAIAPGGRRGR